MDPASFTLDAYQRNRIGTLRPIMQMIDAAEHTTNAINAAVARVGFSFKRLEKLFHEWRDAGDAALLDKRKLPKAKKAASDVLNITDEELRVLRSAAIKTDSILLAIEVLAESEECRPELRELILRHKARRNYPKALRRAARITKEDKSLARGQKGFGLLVHVQYRDNTWKDSAGNTHPLIGGDIFECDDMSVNQPFWYEWPYGGDPLSDMFGVRLGRQVLFCRDVARQKWLGFDMIGRVRDAYRAEDVVRFLGLIGETHGLPRLGYRLEKGVWASRSVRGVKGIANDDTEKTVFGSVRDVVDIHYVKDSHGKGGIEGAFDFLQSLLGLDGIQIGRHRGEYEKTTQLALQCAAGRKHPASCGFLHMSELADRINVRMDQADNRPKQGRLFQGISQEAFASDVTEHPLSSVPAEKRHLFMPVKTVRPIHGGHVRCKVPHYGHLFSFAVPASCAHLGSGYKLLVCFDPSAPTAGAMVFDAEVDGRRDFDAVAEQPYGVFQFSPDAPQLDFSRTGNYQGKKEYLAASRRLFRATGMRQGTGASIDQVADGYGSSARIARGVDLARTENIPAESPRAAEALQARRTFVESGDRATARKLRKVSSAALLDDDENEMPGAPSRISSEALL